MSEVSAVSQSVIPKKTFATLLDSDAVKKRIGSVLKGKATQFISSALSLFNADEKLSKCEPNSIFNACLLAASLDLPINNNLGFAYIIPYNDKNKGMIAQFQIGYKAFIQLAIRSGQVKSLNADVVKKGELKGINPISGEVTIESLPYTERVKAEADGYIAYIRLNNGFEKVLYMSIEELKTHGLKYSQTYKKGFGLWKDDFDAMAKKTVIKLLLSKYAPLSVDMQKAIAADQSLVVDAENSNFEYVDNSTKLLTQEEQEQIRIGNYIGQCANMMELEKLKDDLFTTGVELNEANKQLFNEMEAKLNENLA